jgi:hypothetical protein
MGVTIHFKLQTTKPLINSLLDRAETKGKEFKEIAEKVNIPFEIIREKGYLLFNIGGCESLMFEFKTPAEIRAEQKKTGYSYGYAIWTEDGKKELDEGYEIKKFPQNEKVYASDFCKTQFAGNIIEHIWTAELIREVAKYCEIAEVSDEGDYYHTGNIEDAINSIEENGKMIDSLMSTFENLGWKKEDIIKGKTQIKPFNNN